MFERTQSRLVWILFRKIDFMRIYLFIDLSASRPVPMPGDSFAVAGNRLFLVSLLVNFSRELGKIMTRYDFLWAR